MREFFFNYGLFLAKCLTLSLLFMIVVGGLLILLAKKRLDKATLTVKKLNSRFENIIETMNAEIYSKEQLKNFLKEKKKKAKQDKKLQKDHSLALETRPRIFMVQFKGDIQASAVAELRENITAILCVATLKDEVVIILESSGGMVHHYGLAAAQLQRIRDKHIRLIVIVDLVAASGGYLMACVANKIIAAPFAVLGSIGVLAEVPNFHRFLNKHNIDVEHHTAGEHKTTLTLFAENNDKARAKFKQELQETHELFKNFVKNYRPRIDIEQIATGEHWYAVKALPLQLVDEIMTSDQYLFEKSKEVDIFEISYPTQKNIKQKISSLLTMILYQIKKILIRQFSSPK